jgi:AraC family transcriptional regulator, alkane utilization regulator
MDPLSDTLRTVRLRSAVFFTASMRAPWAVQSPSRTQMGRVLGIAPECLTPFHLLIDGTCLLAVGTGQLLELGTGAVIVLPHGSDHGIMSQPRYPRGSLLPVLSTLNSDEVPEIGYGDGGSGNVTARLVCGYLHCDQQFNPLIGALPTAIVWCRERGLMIVPRESSKFLQLGKALAGARRGWVERTFAYIADEAAGGLPGSRVMLARLVELLYLELLRRYIEVLPPEQTGWLAAVGDPQVGRALRLLHERPDHSWTVSELGSQAGISRSALAQRFTNLVGEPPMHYLGQWRMQLAQHLLLQPGLSISQVASRVGFRDNITFTRAFKRNLGTTPAEWRRRAR